MVRKKNVGDTVMTSFAITCLVTVLFAVVTYSLAFRAGTPFIGGFDRAFLQGDCTNQLASPKSSGSENPPQLRLHLVILHYAQGPVLRNAGGTMMSVEFSNPTVELTCTEVILRGIIRSR